MQAAQEGIKKPKSIVSIDIPTPVLSRCTGSLAVALSPVLNLIRTSAWWPGIWKSEEVTIIPKTPHPDGLDQTRNISCTSIFSKLAESFLISGILSEIDLPETQYGGKKGSGTEHLLAELSTDILRGLDDNRTCVTLMSLDFAKAFNRMSHQFCLRALALAGASSQIISMVYGFLEGRSMRIKMDGALSSRRSTPGGAPQGTKCGNLLFTITADHMELLLRQDGRPIPSSPPSPPPDASLNSTNAFNMDRYDDSLNYSGNLGPFDNRRSRCRNPLNETGPNPLLQLWPRSEIDEVLPLPPRWTQLEMKKFCYVDDQTLIEFSPVTAAISEISTSQEVRHLHAQELSDAYTRINTAATYIGMQLNLGKTQLLCISEARSFNINSYLRVGSEIVQGSSKMKILGYIFDQSASANAQVTEIKRKAAIRAWSIRHLKRAGVPQGDLVQVFAAFIRSAVEYASNVYHGLLTGAQVQEIERIQSMILRVIYGDKLSYAQCLEAAGLPSLNNRRELAFLKFCERVERSPLYSKRWLPLAVNNEYNLRANDKYLIEKTKCTRLMKSPIFRMRKILNDLHRKGKTIIEEIEDFKSTNMPTGE